MAEAVLIDASGWIAAWSPREAAHQAFAAAYESFVRRRLDLVTTNLVVAETHALLARLQGAQGALRFLDELYGDGTHTVLHVDRALEAEATDRWLRIFQDAQVSLADAVSFEVMRREGIRAAFTLDHHFAVAGFEMVPAPARAQPRTRR